VFLQALCQRDVVKVVEGVDGRAKSLVVFLLNEKIVQRLVDGFVVVVLHSNISIAIANTSTDHSNQITTHIVSKSTRLHFAFGATLSQQQNPCKSAQ